MSGSASSGVRICKIPDTDCFSQENTRLVESIISPETSFMAVPATNYCGKVDKRWLKVIDPDNPTRFLGYAWNGKHVHYIGEYDDDPYYGDF